MPEDNVREDNSEQEARRQFLTRTAKLAVSVPAAVVLLRAQRTPAAAPPQYGGDNWGDNWGDDGGDDGGVDG